MRDRPDHDHMHAIGASKLRWELGWEPRHADFAKGLEATIKWYLRNEAWWRPAKDATEALCRAGTVGERRLNRRG